MKQYKFLFRYIPILLLTIAFSSCSEADPIESSITYFPTFVYDDFSVVELGGSFTPTASATEGGEDITVNISGSVDTNTVGVYIITYSATNSDGFDGTVNQTVVVHDPSIIGTDISGAIEDTGRPERTGIISLVEGTTSIFYVTDFAFGGTFPMYFQMNGDVISEISQVYAFAVTSVDLTYDPISKIFTTFVNPYGFDYTFQYQ